MQFPFNIVIPFEVLSNNYTKNFGRLDMQLRKLDRRQSFVCRCLLKSIDFTDYSLLPNGLVFMSCFALSRVENYFVIEPKNSRK
jgi:hypothetical protein